MLGSRRGDDLSYRAFHRMPITLEDLAAHVGYSPFHLSQLVAVDIGSSPMQYFAKLRFQQAKELFLRTAESLTN